MPPARHCRHCLGDCSGRCLLPGDQGLCIHSPVPRMSAREWLNLVRTRRFWRRALFGR
jgi:hypothetical protein